MSSMSVRATHEQWKELLDYFAEKHFPDGTRLYPADTPKVVQFIAREMRQRAEIFGTGHQ